MLFACLSFLIQITLLPVPLWWLECWYTGATCGKESFFLPIFFPWFINYFFHSIGQLLLTIWTRESFLLRPTIKIFHERSYLLLRALRIVSLNFLEAMLVSQVQYHQSLHNNLLIVLLRFFFISSPNMLSFLYLLNFIFLFHWPSIFWTCRIVLLEIQLLLLKFLRIRLKSPFQVKVYKLMWNH